MSTFTLRIENMHCGACVRRVSETLNALPSTHAEAVTVGSARVQTEANPSDLQSALAAAGFPAAIENHEDTRTA